MDKQVNQFFSKDQASISDADKQFLKSNIFAAMDSVCATTDKVIISQIEHIIYNMAQVDYQGWHQRQPGQAASQLHQQLVGRISSGDPKFIQSGFRCLKSIV